MYWKDEICYWSDHPERTEVWARSETGKWHRYLSPAWNPRFVYVVDNEWAELRKAQADGKQLQYYYADERQWTDANLSQPCKNSIRDWRIKPEEPVYEWQWVYQTDDGKFHITGLSYKSEEDMRKYVNPTGRVRKYELSKRRV